MGYPYRKATGRTRLRATTVHRPFWKFWQKQKYVLVLQLEYLVNVTCHYGGCTVVSGYEHMWLNAQTEDLLMSDVQLAVEKIEIVEPVK